MKRLLFVVVCLSGAALYAVKSDDPGRGSAPSVQIQEQRHLRSWGSYLSDLDLNGRPREVVVVARKRPRQAAQVAKVTENETLGETVATLRETAALPEVVPNSAKQSRLAKLVAMSPEKEFAVEPRLQAPKRLATAKPASPVLPGGRRANHHGKEINSVSLGDPAAKGSARGVKTTSVSLTDPVAKPSARGAKRRGFGLFIFGRGRHAAESTPALVGRASD